MRRASSRACRRSSCPGRSSSCKRRSSPSAQRGERFLLQGGDCAESFADCESDTIAKKLKILLQMSLVLLHGLKKPVIRVGRMAGQYAKPRSADTETRDGVTLPSYRGDLVNRPAFTAAEREPDPEAAAARLRARRAHAQFRACAGRRRLRRPASPRVLGPRFRAALAAARRSTSGSSIRSPIRSTSSRRSAGAPVHEATACAFLREPRRPAPARTSRRRRATSSASSAGTTCRRTCRGSACAPPRSTARTSNTSAASPIRSASRSAPAMTRRMAAGPASRSLNPQNEPGRLTLIHRFGAKRHRASAAAR